MRMMPITSCRPGMKLGKRIFSEEGIVLLAEGVELTQGLLRRLGQCGIHHLYIQDPRTEGIEIPELISEDTHRQALQTVRGVFRDLIDFPGRRHTGTYPYVGKSVRQAMHQIMEELYRNRDAMIMLMGVQTVDHYLYMHSLNVCVYTTLLGIAHGYDSDSLLTLGLGAMLHDVGKTRIPMQVLLKPGSLSEEEFNQMKRHTEQGFHLLKDEPNIPLLSAHCAYQHHERLDGSGYPRGIKGDEIHEFAKWIAIVDSYDAMTSHRVYRHAMLPHRAVETLYAGSDSLYDTDMLSLFRDKVAIYPVGMTVKLSTGQTGVVVDINAVSVHRPIVRVLTDESGADLKAPYDIDLSKHLSLMIASVEMEPALL
ncbi:HD-GYP domain-containing protein [Cohnella nanjingensis]|uniref:HD-GYP domain-containing protein n=1 Tax=Cohnella nanjingensis TaxID=1387779 RepID=A0A7X0RRG0_9BACL|nr:HD-GYP domain-containing protein [Cohnella nanjingensis]MBB6672342.1 HD-GYP domain-containing protein [Cohnella nanjingensis]